MIERTKHTNTPNLAITVVPKQIIAYYVGWLKGTPEDIPKMKQFGFGGDMIPSTHGLGTSGVIEHVYATPEVMEKAFREWPDFNYKSFTAIGDDGNQLPHDEQPYYRNLDRLTGTP